ncbi:MAG TPA: hypothetical protein VLH16_02285 [Bacteroidales bacterium]|nr:hypothetical protein [Bacteroidales bacterium]
MKTNHLLAFLSALLFMPVFLMTGCRDKIYEEITYTANVPVYMPFDEFRGAVKRTTPQQLVNPGKIYFKNSTLYVNESMQGVHVIDNSNPASPVIVAFIEIPGNVDIAIRDNILFADSFIDLVALDISDPYNPTEIDRIENAFPNVLPPPDFSYPIYDLDFTKGVVVDWETREVTEMVERGTHFFGRFINFDDDMAPTFGGNELRINTGSTGVGGSMARFTIGGDYLYSVHNDALKVFNIAATPGIVAGSNIPLNRVVETIFPLNNMLFLGTTTGMLIYSLANPAEPSYVSVFEHANACDPVVVEGNFAYVTLRTGTQCFGTLNQLDVVDISSLANPFLVKSYPMYNPHGLGIDNGILFICDGDAGLKVYNASDPMNIHLNQIAHFEDIHAYDVIPLGGILILIGSDGLFQYDYTDPANLTLLSQIPVVGP